MLIHRKWWRYQLHEYVQRLPIPNYVNIFLRPMWWVLPGSPIHNSMLNGHFLSNGLVTNCRTTQHQATVPPEVTHIILPIILFSTSLITKLSSLRSIWHIHVLSVVESFSMQGLLLLTWINFNPAWISNHMHYTVWSEITYPFANTIEVWECISNF